MASNLSCYAHSDDRPVLQESSLVSTANVKLIIDSSSCDCTTPPISDQHASAESHSLPSNAHALSFCVVSQKPEQRFHA